jgi:hypothetical protein
MTEKTTAEKMLANAVDDLVGERMELLRLRLTELSAMTLEGVPVVVREDFAESYPDEDPSYLPFFSESFLYPLLGKGDARTVLAYVNRLYDAVYGREKGWEVRREDMDLAPKDKWEERHEIDARIMEIEYPEFAERRRREAEIG